MEIVFEIGQELVRKRRQGLARQPAPIISPELPEPEPGEIFLGEINDSEDSRTYPSSAIIPVTVMIAMPGPHARDDDFLFEAQRSDKNKAPNLTETNRVKEAKSRKPTHHDDFLYEEQREKKKAKTA